MVFVESPQFSGWRDAHLDERTFQSLQIALIANPDAGALIRGAGGLRKIRVSLQGRGKRGGGRVIYYWWASRDRCYLLFGYAKNVQADLTAEQLSRLCDAMTKDRKNG